MRRKALFYTFLFPAVLVAIILMREVFPKYPILASITTASLFSSVIIYFIKSLFAERFYLSEISIEGDALLLTYFNGRGEKDQMLIRASTIKEMRLERRKWYAQLGTLRFTSAKNNITFLVASNDHDRFAEKLGIFEVSRSRKTTLS